MSVLRSPITMGSWCQKNFRASSKSGRCSKVEVRMYEPMIGVRCPILVSISTITSKPPICTAQMACASPDPRPLRMLRVPKDSTWGCGALRRGDGGAVWRQS